MVTFLEPADYLYGTDFSLASQGGVYNRTMVSIRLEELPEESVLALHKYYQNLRHRGANKDAKFSLFMFPFWNWLARIVPVVRDSHSEVSLFVFHSQFKLQQQQHTNMKHYPIHQMHEAPFPDLNIDVHVYT